MRDETDFLDIRGLRVRFGDREVLSNVNLSVPRGTMVAILGKSGVGKSVFLQCLAGLLSPDAGEICFEGRPLYLENPRARAEFRRRCSYLFQNNALLDSLTVLENVALPLEQTTRLTAAEIDQRAREALERLELEKYAEFFPGQMSGGMRKRLALARALVTRPEIVLFDEPTAGLDPVRRNAVFAMIARYQRAVGFTAVIVTHDVPEAVVAADRIAVLDTGRIRFYGAPKPFLRSNDPVVRAFRDSTTTLRETIASFGARGSESEEMFI